MRTCDDYVKAAKAALGDPVMSDRLLGEQLGGMASAVISNARYGKMSDHLAMEIARVAGLPAGEVVMVARLEREKDPAVKAALIAWAGNVFRLLPTTTAPAELVRGGIRRQVTMGRNQ